MDLTAILSGVLPLLSNIEGNPTVDIFERSRSNVITEDPHRVNSPYTIVMSEVPCVFAASSIKTDLGDNTLQTNMAFYFRREDLLESIGERHLIYYKEEYYLVVPGGIFEIFGIIEARVMRGN